MEQQGEIRIYVACLVAYNNGNLHGAWINACQDEDAIHNEIRDMLKASPIENAEEYAIHDDVLIIETNFEQVHVF